MVKTKIQRTKTQAYAQGIHLYNPTKMEVENAKEEAMNKGFKTIWILREKKKEIAMA